MAEITPQAVKALRDRTGAGMMDCKKALTEAGGDESKAIEIIQKKGLAKVAKRAGAIAAEGLVHSYIHPNGRVGVLVEVNCQTDFVARNEDFKSFVEAVAIQIASMSPLYVSKDQVPDTDKEAQMEIFRGQLAEEETKTGKKRPEQAIQKILDGKLNKWLSENALLEQAYVAEEEKTISQMADELSSKTGEKISVRRFVRYELGEGIEKKTEDFAAEVAATAQGG